MRNFVPVTQREYICAVKNLTFFFRRSPDLATAENLFAFQLHQSETGMRRAGSRGGRSIQGAQEIGSRRREPPCRGGRGGADLARTMFSPATRR